MVHAEKTNAPVFFLTCPIILQPQFFCVFFCFFLKEGNSLQISQFLDFRPEQKKSNKDKNKTSLLHLYGLQRISKKIVQSAMEDKKKEKEKKKEV